jgi:hypothetical protein
VALGDPAEIDVVAVSGGLNMVTMISFAEEVAVCKHDPRRSGVRLFCRLPGFPPDIERYAKRSASALRKK